ncbi:MAG: ABC transporter ATP-binding protein [Dehalococcoidia bacterium]
MLRIEGLKVSYNGDHILRGIDLEVADGECLAVIGESGAGKTTLGLSIMGLVNGNATGKILLDDSDVLSLTEEEMRRLRWNRVSMAFQSAQNQLNPTHRICDQVAEPMVAHGFKSKSEAGQRAEEILRDTGLPAEKFSHYPHQISGGEQQRVLIAMALANNPGTLILDEPISSLDAGSRTEMMAFLKKTLAERAVLITTHDLSTAAQLSTRVATLYGGRIVEAGPTAEVFSRPRHPYTRALLRSYPNMTTVKDLQGIKGRMDRRVMGCPFNPRCTQAISVCRELIPPLREQEGRLLACHRGGIIAALSARGMSKSFGQLKAVDGVSLTLDHGETLALVGQSGSGKTTLARLITGLVEAEAGEISLEEQETDRHSKGFHRTVQMVFQNPGEALSHRMTVLEAVREPLEVQGVGDKEERDRMATKVIEEVELPTTEDFLDEYPHHLSGGELQRVNIARALVLDPKVLIADEPTAFLDSSIQAKILKLLLNLQENRGLSMLFITHDIAVARKISDRIAVMQEGRIVEQGPASRMATSPSHAYTRGLLEAASELHSGIESYD